MQTNNPELCVNEFLAEYSLKKISIKTVYNWMKQLGFQYKPHKKCYYVDTHESDENIAYRNEFIKRYFEYEVCCHRWISIPDYERERLINEGKFDKELAGFEYQKYNTKYFEYHVDDHQTLQELCQHLKYGGYLSVRKPLHKKKAMIISQDECIFKQFLFQKKILVIT